MIGNASTRLAELLRPTLEPTLNEVGPLSTANSAIASYRSGISP
ncbi:hypothetical protein [Paenibacillus foliorum]|nr:hypothetical protein [Paenibacillus foliorum]